MQSMDTHVTPSDLCTDCHPGQRGHVAPGKWTSGLFDCFQDGSTCLLSIEVPCLPCYAGYRWGLSMSRLKILSFGMAMFFFMFLSVSMVIYFFLEIFETDQGMHSLWVLLGAICSAIMSCMLAWGRYRIRKEYQIQGTWYGDWLTYYFCTCCAMAQEARQVDRDMALMV